MDRGGRRWARFGYPLMGIEANCVEVLTIGKSESNDTAIRSAVSQAFNKLLNEGTWVEDGAQ